MERFFKQDRATVSTLVLAGGKSSRMGRDKALIEVNGLPLLQSICSIAQACTAAVYVITSWGDRYQSILPKDCVIISEILPKDNPVPQGPLIGFLQGLAVIETDWCLLLACDLPYLTLKDLNQWLTYLDQVPLEAIALLPQHPKGWEPLCGFYRRRCLADGQEFVKQGGRSFQRWLAQHLVVPLILDDPRCLFNCNTQEDLAQLSPFQA